MPNPRATFRRDTFTACAEAHEACAKAHRLKARDCRVAAKTAASLRPATTAVAVRAARPASAYDLDLFDYSTADPRWRHHYRPSELGEQALCYGIMKQMKPQALAKLFDVTDSSVYMYRKRLKGEMPWRGGMVPAWL